MTNTQANSKGLTVMFIVSILTLLVFSSCGITRLTDEQLFHRNKVKYEIDKVWSEYSHKTDSLWIEYYKKQTMEILILMVVFYIYDDAKLKGNTYDQKRLMNPSAIFLL